MSGLEEIQEAIQKLSEGQRTMLRQRFYLIVLLRLSSYSKDEWRKLINQLELDVPLKMTDSVRDIVGRLLKFLGDNKDVQRNLFEKAQKPPPGISPELMKALSSLIDK